MTEFKGLNSVEVDFEPVPHCEQGLPSAEFVESRIALCVIDRMILQGDEMALDGRPQVENVRITAAALQQIDLAWWSYRDDRDPERAPVIDMTFFITAFRSGSPPSIDIEVLPGRDTWE